MNWIDWGIMILCVVLLRGISLSTKKYMRGVTDFLAANRSAGRYLLTIAGTMGVTGTIVIVGQFEIYRAAGWVAIWWGIMSLAIPAITALSGWVYYRYRETRALTVAQFIEMRYNRRVRIYAGVLCYLSGVINFGIFPATAARFFVYFCGLKPEIAIPHTHLALPTFIPVMLIDLALALMFVTMGGQISVMVTECFQGVLSGFIFIIVTIAVMMFVKWPHMVTAMNMSPVNASMYHPFHTSNVKDFNVWFFLTGQFILLYATMNWQGNQAFNCSGRTPHEQRMGQIISQFRLIPMNLMVPVICIAAVAVLKLPEYAGKAALIGASLKHITNTSVQGQMMVPIALSYLLPVGIKGLFATVMLFFSFTCHDTYMHSWGSIFIQDVYIPITRRTLTPDEHIKMLRWSIIAVAAFSFIFGALYPPSNAIVMFFAVTAIIWVAGSGAVIIGGLYWRRGTPAGAYTALTVGLVLGLASTIGTTVYKQTTGNDFPINGQWLFFLSCLAGIVSYIVVSLITSAGKPLFNMTKMLRRGEYADAQSISQPKPIRRRLHDLVGITHDFTFGDKCIAISLAVWNFGWVAFFVVITSMNLVHNFSNAWWANFWYTFILIQLAVGIPTTIWITVGGFSDIRLLLHSLATSVRDHTDDGRVIHEPDVRSELNRQPEEGVLDGEASWP